MGLDLPMKVQVVVTLRDPRTLVCECDTSKVPSLKLAIAMLEQAARQCRNEEANQEAVRFGQRMAQEMQEAAVAQAIAGGKKQ